MTLGETILKELESEAPATRKSLERIPDTLFSWKPHEKSMEMGYLGLIIAEILRWLTTMIEQGEINFGSFKHVEAKTSADLVKQFDSNMKHAQEILSSVSDEKIMGPFALKRG